MLFALTRSNLLRQLPHENGTILGLTEIVTVSNSISAKADKSEHVFGNCSNPIFGGLAHKIRQSATSSHKYITLRSPRPYASLMWLNWP